MHTHTHTHSLTHTSCLVGPTEPVKEKEGDDVIKSSRCTASAADPGDVACGEHLAAFTTREPLHVGQKVFRARSHYTHTHTHTYTHTHTHTYIHTEPAAGMQLQLDKTIKLGT